MLNKRRERLRRHAIKRRPLRAEPLERRQMLAGDLGLHNEANPSDVNVDGRISSLDVLAVINHLAHQQHSMEGEPGASRSKPKMVDVDNSGSVTAVDALMVINDLGLEGEIVPANTPRPSPLDFSLFPKPADVDDDGFVDGRNLNDPTFDFDVTTNFKTFDPDDPNFEYVSNFNDAFRTNGAEGQLTTTDVSTLLDRASAATSSNDAIIVVVDRNGTMLGVRVEEEVSANLKNDPKQLGFAIDGAAAKARTAAFFSSNAAPLTSRTIRSLSQSTMVQRVVESSPVATDTRYKGPGFVAPIGAGGKFPPEVNFTPQVDLFAIEHQSRDSQRHPGPDQIKGNVDDFYLRTRFNGNPANITFLSQNFSQSWPEAYGIQTDTFYDSSARGIATLPGGVPLYKKLDIPTGSQLSDGFNLVGGIGVFFPGEDGYATFEQGFKHGIGQSESARTNASKVLEAEFAAVVAAAGDGKLTNPSSAFSRNLSVFNKDLPPLPNFLLPTGRIDLVGITLEIYGPNPTRSFRKPGIDRLISVGREVGPGMVSGDLAPIDNDGSLLQAGQPVPEGWLVAPRSSATDPALTAEAVDEIIANGVIEAERTRAAIRLNIDNGFKPGVATRMVFSVADTNGELLGVFRMPDATVFSIDVAVAKARNTAYYADAGSLQDEDRIDFNGSGDFGHVSNSLNDPTGNTLPLGTAFTNRTFRFVNEPRYPSGIEIPKSAGHNLINSPDLNVCNQDASLCRKIAPQSILRMPGIHPGTAENLVNDEPLASEVYQFSPDLNPAGRNTFSVLAFDAFNPSRNFRDPGDAEVIIHGDVEPTVFQPLANQNGVIFFPGSTPLYNEGSELLIGGFGVSGDGVDQDDVVTVAGQSGFEAPRAIRVDAYTVAGVRLPFQKFNRNPGL